MPGSRDARQPRSAQLMNGVMNDIQISPDQGVGLAPLRQVESLFAMYAVIATGGKQVRVAEGQQVHVELLGLEQGASVDFTPVLVVDGDTVLATPTQLAGSKVSGRIVGSAAGPKINGFTYKRRTNQRRRYGHRQHYQVVEITSIAKG